MRLFFSILQNPKFADGTKNVLQLEAVINDDEGGYVDQSNVVVLYVAMPAVDYGSGEQPTNPTDEPIDEPIDVPEDPNEPDDGISRAEVAQLVNFYLFRAPAEISGRVSTNFSDVSRNHKLFTDILEATRPVHSYTFTSSGTEIGSDDE